MAESLVREIPPSAITSVIAEQLRPLVQRIDEDGFYPAEVLRALGEGAAYSRHTEAQGTGPAGIVDAVNVMAEVGAVCLSTAFCIWCQDALVWYLDRSENSAAQNKYLDAAATGRLLGGTGLSNPMKAFSGIEPLALKGTRVPGGYRVTGRLPFVSNIEHGHIFAGIFALEDEPDRRVMALFHAGSDGVALAHNSRFVALEGTATRTVLIRDAFIPETDVLSENAALFVPRIRKGFVLLQAGMGLGIARGALQQMRQDSLGRRLAEHLPLGPAEIEERIGELSARIIRHVQTVEEPDRASFLDVLRTRLAVSWLALEAAQAAVLQFGARGYLVGAEAGRRLREAQFVAIVTPSVKHITTELAKG